MDEAPLSVRLGLPWRSWGRAAPRRSQFPHVIVSLATFAEYCATRNATAGGEPANSDARSEWMHFEQYLLSDETRLPRHHLLNCHAANPQDYNTYIGEDDWPASAATGDTEEAETESSRPVMNIIVEFLQQLFLGLSSDSLPGDLDYGVVVCGDFCAADDAGFASSTGCLQCRSLFDIFSVMRSSTKFLYDVERQCREFGDGGVQFTLRRYVSLHASSEFRLFFGRQMEGATVSNGSISIGNWRLLGSCQRHIDQLFSHLAALPYNENTDLRNAIMAPLQGRSHTAFWNAIEGEVNRRTVVVEGGCTARQPPACVVIFMDIAFETAALPMPVLGVGLWEAKVDADGDALIDVFRMFQCYSQLMAWVDTPRIMIANCGSDLHFDARYNDCACGLPLELQHPEQFVADEQISSFVAARQSEASHQ